MVEAVCISVCYYIGQAMNGALSDSSVTSAVLISGKPGCFIAGADIR